MSYSHDTTSGELSAKETGSLIAASKVNGTSVYNQAGESLGSIHDVMIGKHSGQVSYAVLSFGGFLGLGAKYHPLPWNQLTYSEEHQGYVPNLDKRQLEGAPAYEPSETPDWNASGYRTRIDDYYGAGPISR